MKISVIQMNSQNDKAKNLDDARRYIAAAAKEDKADLVVLPEMFAMLGGPLDARRKAAEEIPGGEAYRMLQDAARTNGVFVHGGSYYERDGDNYYNTTVAFGRDGAELARYRKLHLFDVTTPDGRVTILMPHPERVFRAVQLSYRAGLVGEDGPWMRLFRNARAFVA